MYRFLKGLCLVVILSCFFSFTVIGTETETDEVELDGTQDQDGDGYDDDTGEKIDKESIQVIEYCPLAFRVGYIPSGSVEFISDLRIVFSDVNSDQEYSFLLEQATGFSNGASYQILANTTYDISIAYDNMEKKQFNIVNYDGNEITSVEATTTGLSLLWRIETLEIEEEEVEIVESVTTDSTTMNSTDGPIDVYLMLDTFITKISFIEDNSQFKSFINTYSNDSMKNLFLDINDNDEEAWNNMNSYEQATYMLAYGLPHQRILGGNGAEYTANKKIWLEGLTFVESGLKNIENGNTVYLAIEEVWMWHYENWTATNILENPYDGERMDKSDQEQIVPDDEIEAELVEEMIEDGTTTEVSPDKLPKEDKIKDMDAKETREELASPENFLNILWNNKISLVMLLIVSIIVGVITYKNKKKNSAKLLDD